MVRVSSFSSLFKEKLSRIFKKLLTLFLAQARRNISNNFLSLFIKSLPEKVEIPFQYKVEEIETYPTEVRVLSLQLKENLEYLENMTCDCFDIKRTEFNHDMKSIQIGF